MKWSQIARGVIANWLLLALRAVITLTLVPLVIREVGVAGYGIIVLVSLVVGLAVLADFGLSQGLARELTEYCVLRDIRMRSVLSSTSLAIYASVGTALVLGIFLGKSWLLGLLGIDGESLAAGGQLLIWYALPSVVVSFLSPPFVANLVSINRFDLVRGYEMVVVLLNGIALWGFLPVSEGKLEAWIWASNGSRLFGLVLLLWLFRRHCGEVHLCWSYVRVTEFLRTLSLGGKMYLVQVAEIVTDKINPIIIANFRTGSAVAVYQPGVQLSVMLRPIVGSLANQMHPATTQSHVSRDQAAMRQLLFLGTRYTLLVGIGVCVIGIALAPDFCRLWLAGSLGREWLTTSWVMRGCLAADLCQYLGGVQWAVLVGMRRLNVMVFSLFVASLITLAGALWVMKFSSLGIAWVTVPAIVVALVSRLGLSIYTARACGVRLADYFVSAYRRPLTVGAGLALACLPVMRLRLGESWVGIGAAGVLLGLVWMALVVFVGITANERQTILKRFRGIKKSGTSWTNQ